MILEVKQKPAYHGYQAYSYLKPGKVAMVFVVEGAAPIENEVDRIVILYGLGVRQLGITYSGEEIVKVIGGNAIRVLREVWA